MKKVAFKTLGCKVNSYETEAMAAQFADHGFLIVPFEENADIYIVNTCSVTHVADKKSRQMLHRAKKTNPKAKVVAVGCYAQADMERALLDDAVDIVIGNEKKSMVYDLVMAGENMCSDISLASEFDELTTTKSTLHTRAFVKVEDGCNQFCSYCLIPYLRGRVRSRSIENVVLEVKKLRDSGCKEVVLTGIHLSSFGLSKSFNEAASKKDKNFGMALVDLIREVSKIMGDGRIRLGSLEPRIITRDFAKAISSIPNLCPHFHLSLQSGCDETLKRMNRHYTAAEYEEAVNILREVYEHPAITTDVIVGFPQESEREFQTTYEFLKRINLYEMHIFKYSIRAGTAAEKLSGHVPDEIANKRSELLIAMSRENKEAFAKYYEGKKVSVLLEEEITTEKGRFFTGYSPEYVRYEIPAANYKKGDIISINL